MTGIIKAWRGGSRRRRLACEWLETRRLLAVAPESPDAPLHETGLGDRIITPAPLAALPDGSYQVWWNDALGLTSRRFSSTGSPLEPELTVSRRPIDIWADEAVTASGRQLLAFNSPDGNPLSTTFYAVVRDEFGAYHESAAPLNQTPAAWALAEATPEGGFLVVFANTDTGLLRGRLLDSLGAPTADEFELTGVEASSWHYDLMPAEGGGFWLATAHGGGLTLYKLAADGAPTGATTDVAAPNSLLPQLTRSPSGTIVAGWNAGSSVRFATFSSDGTLINSGPSGFSGDLWDLGYDALGNFAVAHGNQVRFDPAGADPPATFAVTTENTTRNVFATRLAFDHSGGLTTVYAAYPLTGTKSLGPYARRFSATGDATPPTVTGVATGVAPLLAPAAGSRITSLQVSFSENLSTQGGDVGPQSVTNRTNWELWQDGVDVSSIIDAVSFAKPANEIRYVATLALARPLGEGAYELRLHDAVTDVAGNALDGNEDGATGGPFVHAFDVDSRRAASADQQLAPNSPTTYHLGSMDLLESGGVLTLAATGATLRNLSIERYDTSGVSLGPGQSLGEGRQPALAADPLGNTIVVWISATAGDGTGTVQAQRFDAQGVSLGPAFEVDPTIISVARQPAVALNSTGDFAIAWDDGQRHFVRFYSADGTPRGAPLEHLPSVAADAVALTALPDGTFVWLRAERSDAESAIVAERFTSEGTPLNGPSTVASAAAGAFASLDVATRDSGESLVAWAHDDAIVASRWLAADGTPIDSALTLNAALDAARRDVHVSLAEDGRALVTWLTIQRGSLRTNVAGRWFDEQGLPLGEEVGLNRNTAPLSLGESATVALADGRHLVAWSGVPVYTAFNTFAPVAATRVTGVALQGGTTGEPAFEVPLGSGEQLRTIPRGAIDRISLTFDQEVAPAASDLIVEGDRLGFQAVSSVAFDSASGAWVFQLAEPIRHADQITLSLAGTLADAGGTFLDGEWDNPSNLLDTDSSTQSGDGARGGSFTFRVNLLPGDANRDNLVTGADYTIWSNNFSNVLADRVFTQGDWTGDGLVNGADYTFWSDHFGLDFTGVDAAGDPLPDEIHRSPVALPETLAPVADIVAPRSEAAEPAPRGLAERSARSAARSTPRKLAPRAATGAPCLDAIDTTL